MRGVSTLIRLAQHEVAEQRADLARIVRARADAEAALGAHDAEIAREASLAMTDTLDLAAFSVWARQAARIRTKLQQRFAELVRTEAAAREALRDAIAQVKRLESVWESAETATRLMATRRADIRADEREVARYTASAAASQAA